MEDSRAVRLHVRLARSGIASRRRCEKFIAEGRIMVNGKTITSPGAKVMPHDDILFDGRSVNVEKRKVYIALHKPAGFLCSDEDPDRRPLAKSLLEPAFKERIFHVGRLDYMTSGLIFFTNDGNFARVLTHPSCEVEKEYLLSAKNTILPELLEHFVRGMRIDGVHYKASKAQLISPRTARIVLCEGKNRELRRVFLSKSIAIKKVHRVRIGPIRLKGIAPGHFRELKKSEIRALMNTNNTRESIEEQPSRYVRKSNGRRH